ncbi:hypothetical protein C7447_10312 [Tenacibaculum adriaticum]|uniref:Secreted protein n=1 Tax=Tenacibaculum adriaticum TaxID=413713 RepID=A0A5S5DPL3_9FLAO|nr:hypothetical protein [Tenacibaculum adriaticum]TYP97847.1 hypothetical protein C7447_10312 [Tenacibaculum adriaticum]
MKAIFTKISSFTLALLVLLSTFSLTIEKHFCGDFLVNVSYFGKAQGCADEMGKGDCDALSVVKKKKCCKDEIQQIEGQDDFQNTSTEKFDLKQQQFALAFVVSYNNLFKDLEKQIVPHKDYSPPNLVTDIQVLHEVFII